MSPGKERNRQVVEKKLPERTGKTARLAEEARAGDRHAFEELMGLFHSQIFRLVSYRTGSTMDAEDLTQDIFLSALRGLSGLKEPERFKPWLFRIAVNRVRDFHRKRRFLHFLGFEEAKEGAAPQIRETGENAEGGDDLEKKTILADCGAFYGNPGAQRAGGFHAPVS